MTAFIFMAPIPDALARYCESWSYAPPLRVRAMPRKLYALPHRAYRIALRLLLQPPRTGRAWRAPREA